MVTSDFVKLAKATAKGYGVEDLPINIVEAPLGGIAPEAAAAKADKTIEEIIRLAINGNPKSALSAANKVYPAAMVSVDDSLESINDLFYRNAWTDGLPIIPPTPERVERMLTGTTLKPDTLIGLIPPRMGAATVQVIAINSVMAGAKPEHLPVIIAAVKAAIQPEVELRRWLMSTRPTYVSMFVQGPIVKELGIQYGQSALAPGPKPNVAIGRAFMLTLRLLGGIISPADKVSTMTTLGTPNISFCLGENEDALPQGWSPLRVDSGCKLEDSVVSVFGTCLPGMQNDHDSTDATGVLNSTCYHIGGRLNRPGGVDDHAGMVILFGPEHAATIAKGGFSKEATKKYIFENSKIPRDWLVKGGVWQIGYEFESLSVRKEVDDQLPMIHQFDSPEQITISVAGGAGKQSILHIGYNNTPPVIIRGAALTQAGR